ncbi:DUF7620 family protein [Rhodococcus marinonascens]|uniref:DUF7620 family protein n=1 Tax=Rhodococcus marinonascens TaxID=38311 RepID=UPI00093276CF|nr:hypothetical protein [Rhodococcus marinonascens]
MRWRKWKRDNQGLDEARRALERARDRDVEIAELGRKHRKMLAVNGFGESAEAAILARRGRQA